MALDLHQREVEDITILDLHGRLVLGPEVAEFRDRLKALAAGETTRLILNMQRVSYIDSAGLGTLVIAHSSIAKRSGYVKLLHVPKRAAELLILTRLAELFEVFDDEQAAINSFFPDRVIKRFDILEFVRSHSQMDDEAPQANGSGASEEPQKSSA